MKLTTEKESRTRSPQPFPPRFIPVFQKTVKKEPGFSPIMWLKSGFPF
jgi:hypothetical protein